MGRIHQHSSHDMLHRERMARHCDSERKKWMEKEGESGLENKIDLNNTEKKRGHLQKTYNLV